MSDKCFKCLHWDEAECVCARSNTVSTASGSPALCGPDYVYFEPNPAPVQSAEEFITYINHCKTVDSLRELIESRDAAQRQAGREEALKDWPRVEAAWVEALKKRYAALEEAARTLCDNEDMSKIVGLLLELEKALSDLGKEKS